MRFLWCVCARVCEQRGRHQFEQTCEPRNEMFVPLLTTDPCVSHNSTKRLGRQKERDPLRSV